MTRPMRSTRQRTAVAELLARVDGFRSADKPPELVHREGAFIARTTDHRHVQALADTGEFDRLRSPDGEAVSRVCGSPTHHHLVCRVCGRTVANDGPAGARWADQVSAEHGLTAVEHTPEIFGTCRDCAAGGRRL